MVSPVSDSVVEVAYAVRTLKVVIIRIINPPEKKIVKGFRKQNHQKQ